VVLDPSIATTASLRSTWFIALVLTLQRRISSKSNGTISESGENPAEDSESAATQSEADEMPKKDNKVVDTNSTNVVGGRRRKAGRRKNR
jgi:hypothetical protein